MTHSPANAAPRKEDAALTREGRFDPRRTCLLLVDTQNYVWNDQTAEHEPYFDRRLREAVLPNLQGLIGAFRSAKAEARMTKSFTESCTR